MFGSTSSTSSQRHLQGLVTRRAITAEPKNAVQYFGYVAAGVQYNLELTKLRTYNLKRRATIAYKGYEAVLSRKKRVTTSHSVKPSVGNMMYVSRPGAIPTPTTATFNPAAVLQLQAMLPRAQPVTVKPAQKIAAAAAASSVTPLTTLTTPTVTSSVTTGKMTAAQMQRHQQQMKSAQLQQQPKRSDFVVGTTVLIRNTADLIACGARNLAGKNGRIVAAPQIYGQELFSVYIDEHEALFQVPFNALTLVARPTPTQQQQTQQMQAQLNVAAGQTAPNEIQRPNDQVSKGSKLAKQIKMEYSFQLHRLMQQQYREIQVLQQRYAECRLADPTALSGIQKELSKLRLVHLSQVQTLKSKQALDMIGK
ncbi:unnamed protein product [Peronospora destructor]|uniref:Uncharacterized protein n=1 Tax=Peronospora destructor TaxID=86335 RepID=A0AAV0URT0_9STRA|nr:unnamed protein product [Peronospora destructor]